MAIQRLRTLRLVEHRPNAHEGHVCVRDSKPPLVNTCGGVSSVRLVTPIDELKLSKKAKLTCASIVSKESISTSF